MDVVNLFNCYLLSLSLDFCLSPFFSCKLLWRLVGVSWWDVYDVASEYSEVYWGIWLWVSILAPLFSIRTFVHSEPCMNDLSL